MAGRPGRPKGKIDSCKRKGRKTLSSREEREIVDDWLNYPASYFQKKYNISNSAIRNFQKRRNLPNKMFSSSFVRRKNIRKLMGVSGIYGIVTSDYKAYIGSSVNIGKRITKHLAMIANKSHHNKSLQLSYNDLAWFGIVEECSEDQLLVRESHYLQNLSCLHNDRGITTNNELTPVLTKKHIDLIRSKVDITENNCWEFKGKIKKDGYCVIQKEYREYKVHRVMYYYFNDDDHNKIVRHLCNNKKCCNPEHLKAGSVRENVMDRGKVDI